MIVRMFTMADASFERSPGQEGDVFAAKLVDERHGGPITVGYGRYGPGQSISEILAVDDVMVVLQGRLSVMSDAGTLAAGPGEIVHMPTARRSPFARTRRAHSPPMLPIPTGGKRPHNLVGTAIDVDQRS